MLPLGLTYNKQIDLSYPTQTSISHIHAPRFARRRIHVLSARDLVVEPLTIDEFRRRPFLNRSRWLLRAWDSDLKAWRQFYLGSSAEYRSPGTLQLAIYETTVQKIECLISRQFEPTIEDRRELMRVICDVERDGVDLDVLRVIAPDMRVS